MSLIVTTPVTILSTGVKAQRCQCYENYICPRVNDSTASNNYEKHIHTHKNLQSGVRVLYLVSVSHKGDTCVVYLEAVVLIAAQVHITLIAFHGGFLLLEWVVLVGYPWVLSFMMFVSCIAHDTDVVFALSSYGPVVCTIQSWVTFVGCTVWSADLMFLHIVISNQLVSQVQSERQKITLHYISHLVIDDMSLDDVSVV